MKKLSILLLAMLCAGVVLGQKPIIAVYVVHDDTDSKETIAIKKVLETKLVEAIDKSNLFTATERSEAFLSQLKKEQLYQLSGSVRDDQIIRLGRQSGAQFLCIAEIIEVFGEKFVSTKLIETESNNVSGTANSSGSIKSMNDLVTIASEVSSKLIQETPQGKTAQQIHREQQVREDADKPYIYARTRCGLEVSKNEYFDVFPHDKEKYCKDGWRLPSASDLDCLCKDEIIKQLFTRKEYFTSKAIYNERSEIGYKTTKTEFFGEVYDISQGKAKILIVRSWKHNDRGF